MFYVWIPLAFLPSLHLIHDRWRLSFSFSLFFWGGGEGDYICVKIFSQLCFLSLCGQTLWPFLWQPCLHSSFFCLRSICLEGSQWDSFSLKLNPEALGQCRFPVFISWVVWRVASITAQQKNKSLLDVCYPPRKTVLTFLQTLIVMLLEEAVLTLPTGWQSSLFACN